MDKSWTPDRSTRETTPDLQIYVAEKLNGIIFSAWYTDRVWIEDLHTYLDEIRIDEDEKSTIKALKSVLRRVKKLRPGFSGIEKKGENVSIYVDWSQEQQVIGHYWLQIRNAYCGPTHVILTLKILRSVIDSEKASVRCPHCGKLPILDSSSNTQDDPLNLSEIARQLQWKFQDFFRLTEWWTEAKPHLSLENFFKLCKFFIILTLAAISSIGNFIVVVLFRTDGMVNAMSNLIRSLTPAFLSCTDLVNRLVAGILTLFAMMWRDWRRSRETPIETSERLAFQQSEAKRNFLEGPKKPAYPYARDGNRPYKRL